MMKFLAIVVLAGVFPLLMAEEAAPKVGIALYYESLCPGCRAFIRGQLYPTFTKVGEIMDIELIPYGNAQESQYGNKWVFTCQHGQNECIGNIIESCAINILQNVTAYFPFIHCFEEYASSYGPDQNAQYCASLTKIDYSPIKKCQGSSQGNELEHEMAVKTNALVPRHQYVPWITMNGKHTDEIQNQASTNLLGLVCATYKGTKPAACSRTNEKDRCYRN